MINLWLSNYNKRIFKLNEIETQQKNVNRIARSVRVRQNRNKSNYCAVQECVVCPMFQCPNNPYMPWCECHRETLNLLTVSLFSIVLWRKKKSKWNEIKKKIKNEERNRLINDNEAWYMHSVSGALLQLHHVVCFLFLCFF